MKKLKNYLVILFTFVTLCFVGISCETEPVVPACESGNYGTVIVKNNTGSQLMVDVNGIDETWIGNGYKCTYTKVSAGSITIWGSYDGSNWTYDYGYLSSCETFTYTWHSKKSSNGLYLEISKNGEVIKVITDLQVGEKIKN